MDIKIYMKSIVIFLVFSILSFFSSTVNADASTYVSISPLYSDIKLKQEEVYNGFFNIKNSTEYKLTLEISEKDIINSSITESNSKWVSISEINQIIDSGEDQRIEFTLNIPRETNPGVYYKYIQVNFINENNSLLSYTLGYNLNIIIDSLFTKDFGNTISSINVNQKLLIEESQKLYLTINNASPNTFTRPLVNINLLSPTGVMVNSKVLNDSLSILDAPNMYEIELDIPNTGIFNIGQYTIQILVTDTLSGKSIYKNLTFFYIGKSYLIIFLVTLVAAILIIKFWKNFIKIISSDSNLQDKVIGIKKYSKKRKK